ncbi:hypothetical protein [Escherichia coli]|uniref:hypothetical protein n=1 Tax=Escherichia coli TaxID=562 RepID=UPI001F051EEF|nr:hypothetical protein [Escherichia coli]MCH0581426.1 hypothetical protein [Escherichia coli]
MHHDVNKTASFSDLTGSDNFSVDLWLESTPCDICKERQVLSVNSYDLYFFLVRLDPDILCTLFDKINKTLITKVIYRLTPAMVARILSRVSITERSAFLLLTDLLTRKQINFELNILKSNYNRIPECSD